jgi:dipeptidyl aminopeptidase/acylaminoacyl peptidase
MEPISYALLGGSRAFHSSIKNNISTLYLVDLNKGTYKDLNTPYVEITLIHRVSEDSIVFRGVKTNEAESLVLFTVSSGSYNMFKETSNIIDTLPDGIISTGKPYSFSLPSQKNEYVHCMYYLPLSPTYIGDKDEKPPCVVGIHGGPTSRIAQGLAWTTQYFTTRGFGW